MFVHALTLAQLTKEEGLFLGIPLYGQAVYGQSVYMSKAEAQRRLDAVLALQGEQMADQATVALNISNIANGEQKKKFQKAVDANTPVAPAGGGPAAPAGPETLALTDTVGKITAKEQEIADADTVLKSKYKEQADLYKLAAKQYGTLGGVVQTGSNGVASYIIGKGYDVVSPATHVTSLPQVTGLDAQDGDEEHSADLNCKSLRDHNVEYVFEGTQDPAGATGFHLIDVVKPSKCTAKNLAAGVWWFRVAARRNNVVGPWSQLSRYFAH